MTRREFLSTISSTLLASFSGCLSGTRTGENGETEPPTYDVQDSPDELPETIDYSVSVIGGGLRYSGSPLALTIELTNETNEEIAFVERRSALFHGVRNETEHLVLIPDVDSNEDGYEFSDGCWTDTVCCNCLPEQPQDGSRLLRKGLTADRMKRWRAVASSGTASTKSAPSIPVKPYRSRSCCSSGWTHPAPSRRSFRLELSTRERCRNDDLGCYGSEPELTTVSRPLLLRSNDYTACVIRLERYYRDYRKGGGLTTFG